MKNTRQNVLLCLILTFEKPAPWDFYNAALQPLAFARGRDIHVG